MFNLIITIIAIALVVVLTATSVYYGGAAFNEGTADAMAATYINQAQQVQAAAVIYSVQKGGSPASIGALSDHLRGQVAAPSGDFWDIDGDFAVLTATAGDTNEGFITVEVCDKINESAAGALVSCFVSTGDASADVVTAAAVTTSGDSVVVLMGY